jgi:lysyl-tRNA synthetase class 2
MGFLDNIKNIFSNARKNASLKAYTNLEEGKKINFAPRSDRYTFGNRWDTQYDKSWTPKTKEEKKTLSPEGYFRIGEKQNKHDEVFRSIFDAAKTKARATDDERVRLLKEKGEKARRTDKRTLEKNAKTEAERIMAEEKGEKQVSIPSTAIAKIKYNPENEGLKVRFQKGKKEYFYPSVPAQLIQRWLEAPSKGEFFMKNIHDQYSIFKGKRKEGNKYVTVPNHAPKTKAQQTYIKKYMKDYERKNKKRVVGDSSTVKGVKFIDV